MALSKRIREGNQSGKNRNGDRLAGSVSNLGFRPDSEGKAGNSERGKNKTKF
jgi:hypothetical protein